MPNASAREPENTGPDAEARCACGSGLRHRSCCGLNLARVELTPASGPHAGKIGEMSRAYNGGDKDTARRLALDVLEEAPGQREALAGLYNVLKDAGELDAAATVLERLAYLYINDAVIRAIAAEFFLRRNDQARSQLHARMLVRLAPQSPTSHMIMGRVFLTTHNAQAAEHHFRRAIMLGEGGSTEGGYKRPEAEFNLALALRDQSRMEEARALFSRLGDEQPKNVAILLQWSRLEEADRKLDAAMALLDRAEAITPGNPQIAVARAGLHQRSKLHEQALATLDDLRGRVEQAGGEGSPVLQRGQILDSLGRYDEAFEAYAAFKAAMREAGQVYEAERAERLVASLREFFTEGRSRLLPRAGVREDSPQPIFIIGFPRSGTTLVEQTITSHPNIAAGDELPIINGIVARAQVLLGSPAPYPVALSELWLGDKAGLVETLRDFYLNEAARMGAVDPSKPWFTDKMPLNETHLGLITLLFPQSPVIHLVRHPLDVVLSVFSNSLTHGFNCASSLETAARHYALVADLIAHYRAVLPVRYHAVRYEDLVVDQERQVRALFEFLGEPFDARTLDFTANPRYARTASYAQVTEKLYERSRYRYRNYRKHLEPVIPILQPAIERLGYTIED